MSYETPLAQALARLAARGFTEEFRAEAGELVRVGTAGPRCRHRPQALHVEEIVRFEGRTDPDDEAILFALRCDEHGVRGTYASAYGPAASPADAEVVRLLGRPAHG